MRAYGKETVERSSGACLPVCGSHGLYSGGIGYLPVPVWKQFAFAKGRFPDRVFIWNKMDTE